MKKFLMGMLGVLALTACSSEEVIPDQKPSGGLSDKDSRFMSISIRNTNPGTRAAGDQSGNLYEEGLGDENDVKNIRFYFFKADGSAFPMTADEKNFFDANTIETETENGMPNVEKKLKAVIVLQGTDVSFKDLKSMVAVVNSNRATLGSDSKSLNELQSIVEDYANGYNDNYSYDPNEKKIKPTLSPMLMTSSVFGTPDEFSGCEVYINPTKLKTDEKAALDDPVEMYVERVLAKVRVTASWNSDVDQKTLSDGKTILVALKDSGTKTQYTTSDGKKIYAKLIGWGMQSFTNKSYLFKNIGGKNALSNWNTALGEWWNGASNYRSYWALNPSTAEIKHAKHTAASAKIGTKLSKTENGVTTTIVYDGDFRYTQENAGDNSADGLKLKSDYDPFATTTSRTQVYINAELVDENGNKIDLVEWGGQKYTEQDAVTAMLNAVNKQIWIRKEDGQETITKEDGTQVTTTKYKYETIKLDMVHMVPAENAIGADGKPKADKESENSKRYLSYIQLAKEFSFPDGYEHKFFDANHNEIVGKTVGGKDLTANDVVNGILSTMPGAKAWRDGKTYYYLDLKHLNVNPDADANKTKGGYGVVRNHIYEVELNTIFGLGTPVLIPDEEIEIIPQKPTPDAFYLGARINILSWRVVANKVGLDWSK